MATEKRLIDANFVKSAVKEVMAENGSEALFIMVAENICKMLDHAPTVDAVEVVRCKDCKHWHEETGWCNQHSCFIEEDGEPCHPWESNNWKMLSADDFCSYGERRTAP